MQKRTIALTALGAVAGLAVIGNIVGDEPTNEPADEPAAVVEEAPAPSPEPEPTTTEAPAPEPEPEPEPTPEPEPEPVEAPTPPDASDDLDRIILESVWNSTDRQAQNDMCLLYTISSDVAWDAFSDGGTRTDIPRSVFDDFFTEVC